MNLTEKETDGVVILELSGKIMGGPDASLLNDKLHELIEANKVNIVADLAKVDWMNSSGLGILIRISVREIPPLLGLFLDSPPPGRRSSCETVVVCGYQWFLPHGKFAHQIVQYLGNSRP